MKFLVMTKMTGSPNMSKEFIESFRKTLEDKLDSGEWDCLYQRVAAGGGVGIVNADSNDHLWEIVATFPQSNVYEWHVEPLAEIDFVFDKILEWVG